MARVVRPVWIRCLVGAAAIAAAAGRVEAAPIYNPGNGHYYDLTTPLTEAGDNWLLAEAEAVSRGGHLVSITSSAEQLFLETTFLTLANDRTIYWIGLTDQLSEGTFVWTNGDPYVHGTSYGNWQPGEPNDCPQCNFDPPGEDYVALNWHYGVNQTIFKGTWNDTTVTSIEFGPQPNGITQGIIEWNSDPSAAAVPEPTSLLLLGSGLTAWAVRKRRRAR